jgi:hypothetical protein
MKFPSFVSKKKKRNEATIVKIAWTHVEKRQEDE